MSIVSKEKRPTRKKRSRERIEPHHTPVEDRIDNFNEVNLGYLSNEEIQLEAERCYECRKPKCVEACPAHFDVRNMLVHVREGDFEKATEMVDSFYCFPSSFNRICPAFCQDACIAGKKGDPIQILNIKRYLADNFDKPDSFYQRAPLTGKKIAIIGSGPAGLTAGYELSKLGHEVTIFEKRMLGGMLAVGIPEYRLSNKLLHREIRDLENVGVTFVERKAFGRDFTSEDLFNSGYDAIFIAHGAHKPKYMGIPGEELEGSMHAIDFLRKVAYGQKNLIGEKVIVVGGGDVAIDAVRVSRRLGAEAEIVYRRTIEEMPATQQEIEETLEEKVPIHFLTNPVEIIGENGKVTGIKLIKMELGEPDDSGRRRPVPIEGSEYIMECDTVIQAISQEPEYEEFSNENIDISRWHTIEVDEETYMTKTPGIFAAGDNVSGPKTAIEAIAGAKKAVASIDNFVMNKDQEHILEPGELF